MLTSRPDQDTAAYSASQPLFTVLKGAISRVETVQLPALTEAAKTVQYIHVKIPQEHIKNNGTLPTNYTDSLISAWKSATESYVRIFEQLCELTGPDASSGKLPEDSYVGFQKLLYTAEAARVVAFEQDEAITQAKRKAESSSDETESDASKTTTPNKQTKQTPAETASVKRGTTADHSPTQIAQRPQKKQRTAGVRDANNEADKPADTATNQATEPSAGTTAQRLKPKQIRKQRKQRIQQHREQQEQKEQQAGTQSAMQQENGNRENAHLNAQYEDVSVELEKRLKIKEDQKKAKKEAKKRKRDSQGSHILEAEPGAEKEAVQARAKALAQKPAKKRAKSENGESVRADGENRVPQKGKRGNDEGEQAAGEGAGARRSKRNKTE